MASKKYIALWNFENEYEGKVKIGEEITLNDERARELRNLRLVHHVSKVKAVEKAVAKEAAETVGKKKEK